MVGGRLKQNPILYKKTVVHIKNKTNPKIRFSKGSIKKLDNLVKQQTQGIIKLAILQSQQRKQVTITEQDIELAFQEYHGSRLIETIKDLQYRVFDEVKTYFTNLTLDLEEKQRVVNDDRTECVSVGEKDSSNNVEEKTD